MKSLESFIKEDQLKEKYKNYLISEEFVSNEENGELWIYQNFLKDLFLYQDPNKPNFLENYFNYFPLGLGESINSYEMWQIYLYETLNLTYSTEELKKEIEEKFNNIDEVKIIQTGSKYKHIHVITKEYKKLLNDKKFISLCNRANYEIIHNGTNHTILLKPYKGEEITDKILSHKYIYHFTTKHVYETIIKEKGLVPKAKESSKLERVYFFYSENPMKSIASQANFKFRYLKNEGNEYKIKQAKKGYVLLTIDTSKLQKGIKFFEDSGGNSNMFWTHEYISPYAIINVKDIDMSKYPDFNK